MFKILVQFFNLRITDYGKRLEAIFKAVDIYSIVIYPLSSSIVRVVDEVMVGGIVWKILVILAIAIPPKNIAIT